IARGQVGLLATWDGLPMFAHKGPDLPTSHLGVEVENSQGAGVGARVELWRGTNRWSVHDIFPGETARIQTLPGDVEIGVTRGRSEERRVGKEGVSTCRC